MRRKKNRRRWKVKKGVENRAHTHTRPCRWTHSHHRVQTGWQTRRIHTLKKATTTKKPAWSSRTCLFTFFEESCIRHDRSHARFCEWVSWARLQKRTFRTCGSSVYRVRANVYRRQTHLCTTECDLVVWAVERERERARTYKTMDKTTHDSHAESTKTRKVFRTLNVRSFSCKWFSCVCVLFFFFSFLLFFPSLHFSFFRSLWPCCCCCVLALVVVVVPVSFLLLLPWLTVKELFIWFHFSLHRVDLILDSFFSLSTSVQSI